MTLTQAFTMMDQDRDGILSRADLVTIFDNIGKFVSLDRNLW